MPRNHYDLAYFENRTPKCTFTYMSAASQKKQTDFFKTQVCASLSADQPAGHQGGYSLSYLNLSFA